MCARIISSRIGYNAWRCVEAGPVPVMGGRRKSLSSGSCRKWSSSGWKRPWRACVALEVRGQTGIGDPGGSRLSLGPDVPLAGRVLDPARPRPLDAEGPELHGKNHRTGHGDVS